MDKTLPHLVLFHQDLRVSDNQALYEATQATDNALPVYIYDKVLWGGLYPGAASQLFLHHALSSLKQKLQAKGSDLLVFEGETAKILEKLQQATKFNAIHRSISYEPLYKQSIEEALSLPALSGVEDYAYQNNTLLDPLSLRTKEDKVYRVFTPFYKAALQLPMPDNPAPTPSSITTDRSMIDFDCSIEALALRPNRPWGESLMSHWQVSEQAASEQLDLFIEEAILDYKLQRDYPAISGTSKLSVYLHFGLISPRQIFYRMRKDFNNLYLFTKSETGAQCYFREIYWREFGYYLLWHFPHTVDKPMNPKFNAFPWANNMDHLEKWKRGQTGYPIVDAAMKQLWHTGWMHNRLRMIVASFLVKNLRLHWIHGAEWFMDTLVDADLASNTMGWQWAGGCGADAAPYFRIFNPWTQSKKFDADATFIKTWLPELDDLDAKSVHLADRNDGLFYSDYPAPIVDHATSRSAALAAFEQIKNQE